MENKNLNTSAHDPNEEMKQPKPEHKIYTVASYHQNKMEKQERERQEREKQEREKQERERQEREKQ
jgi:hypothetical protein